MRDAPTIADLRVAARAAAGHLAPARAAAGHLAPARAAAWRQAIAGLNDDLDGLARRLTPLVILDLYILRSRFARHPEKARAAEAATTSPTGVALNEVARLIRAAMETDKEARHA